VNVQDLKLHPETDTISPWYCKRFDDGMVLNQLGYLDVKYYWTPTMPATILSPHAIGTQFKCRGYSICNDFRGLACTVTFHHPLCQLQDILLTLFLCCGAERSAAVSGPKLHAVTCIDAREGQVHPKLSGTREGIDDHTIETREGIDESEMIAGSKIREGPSQCLCHCNSCSTCQSELPHQMIANAMQSMLVGAGLPAKFWPYAF
jgi:hypothetical protein